MKNVITVTGVVSTEPRSVVTDDGLDILSFRLASTHYHHDPHTDNWIDPDTNWYIVTAFRQLAVNVHTSVSKGDRVIVTGGLRIRDWATAEKTGTQVEIEAAVIGHDLNWGNSDWHYTSLKTAILEEAVAETDGSIRETQPDDSIPGNPDSEDSAPRGDSAPMKDSAAMGDSAPVEDSVSGQSPPEAPPR